MRMVSVCALVAMVPAAVIAQDPVNTAQTHPAAARAQAPHGPSDTAQTASALLRSNGGSLLRASLAAQPDGSFAKASQVSFFAVALPEPHVLKKHDLITIIVRELSESTTEGTTDLKKQADLDAKIDQYVRFSFNKGSLENGVTDVVPEIKVSGNRNFKGEATVDRTDSLILRIQAEIIDVKPNNTLVVQARATITSDEEVQTMVLSGTCRAEDVTTDNTILSTQLYDKGVTKTHKGAVRDNTKRGLLSRLLDVLNPF